MRVSTEAERQRLLDDFVRLCEIESPSKRERAVAEAVRSELERARAGGRGGRHRRRNRLRGGQPPRPDPGPEDARTILLCAHLDTVPLAGPVEVTRENGVLSNRHDAILGADNKAAVATVLGSARRLATEGSPVGVELLFTTCEEVALAGAKAFDRGRLRSEFGFVFDHASPIGEIVLASPTYYRIEAAFRGQAAHAGIRPEAGRNAIAAAARARRPRWRSGGSTTPPPPTSAQIEGGTAANVVAERCQVVLEARSLDDAPRRRGRQLDRRRATEAASDAECDVETTVERLFRGYKLQRTAPVVEVAAAALDAPDRARLHQHRRRAATPTP